MVSLCLWILCEPDDFLAGAGGTSSGSTKEVMGSPEGVGHIARGCSPERDLLLVVFLMRGGEFLRAAGAAGRGSSGFFLSGLIRLGALTVVEADFLACVRFFAGSGSEGGGCDSSATRC